MNNYSKLLNDQRWKLKRKLILQNDKFRCFACGTSKKTLHVHHIEYNGAPWKSESFELQTLCEDCHNSIGRHRGGVGYKVVVQLYFEKCPNCKKELSLEETEHSFCGDCKIWLPVNHNFPTISSSIVWELSDMLEKTNGHVSVLEEIEG